MKVYYDYDQENMMSTFFMYPLSEQSRILKFLNATRCEVEFIEVKHYSEMYDADGDIELNFVDIYDSVQAARTMSEDELATLRKLGVTGFNSLSAYIAGIIPHLATNNELRMEGIELLYIIEHLTQEHV